MNPIRVFFLTGLALSLGLRLHAVDDKKMTPEEREIQEAKAEEEAELNSKVEYKYLFEGQFTMNPVEEGKEPPVVIGTFVSEGMTYALKVSSPDLYAQLKKLDGKQVTLIGRPRNQNKNFVANGIQLPSAKPAYSRPRGSL